MTSRIVRIPLALLVLAALTAVPAFSQAGHGKGRLNGLVLDADRNPLPGVKVVLKFSDGGNVSLETKTGKKGDWSFIGLGTGKWTLSIAAEGFMPYEKVVRVSQLELNPKVEVVLAKAEKAAGVISDDQSVVFLEQGNQAYKDGRYDEAIEAFQKFQEANPGLYQIQVSIADCYREKGDYEKAIAVYNEVLKVAETDLKLGREMSAKALSGIGNCHLKQGRLQEAQEYFQKSIEASPKDAILAYNVGEIYFSNQALDEAVRFFELAAQIKADWPDPWLKLGYVYLNKADNAKAAESFEKFLVLEPEGERAALAKNVLGLIKK